MAISPVGFTLLLNPPAKMPLVEPVFHSMQYNDKTQVFIQKKGI